MSTRRWEWVVCIAVGLALAQVDQPPAAAQSCAAYARIEGARCVIGNAALERIISLSDGHVCTTSIRNKLANREILVESAEFALTVNETEVLKAADFILRNKEVQDFDRGAKRLTLTLVCEKHGIEVQLRHEVAPGALLMRKMLAVRAVGPQKALLNRIEVERFSTGATCTLGGLGQPVFIADSMFTGLEYPAAHNEARDNARAKPPTPRFSVALRHLPGKVLTPVYLESKPAVLGVTREGAVERGFAEYLARIRIRPRTHVHYNSWYDIRQDKMSTELFLDTFAQFKKNLCDKYGVRMDSFVPDDGWQDRSSIWEVSRKLFPQGLGELSAGLKAGGSSLGLWHPLTAVEGNLVMKWCREHGYETDKAGTHLCLSAPKHNAQLRAVMTRNVKQYDLTYLKHDFNSFACDGQRHGHLSRPEYGFEANVDAYIEMLKLLKQANPKVFLNCTGGMWLSPWWLMYCDTVWRGANDTGYEQAHPFVDQRLQSISYVDGVLYDDFVKNRDQFPISALMVCGIVYGQLHMLGGTHEPLESWTDNTVWSVCLGLMMKELYITPSLLSETQWDVLGKSLRWAEANKDVLVETQMILGNPHRGEVLGYKHAVGDRTIVFLRNPALRPQKAAIDFRPPEGNATRRLVEIVYPYRKVLARDADPAQTIEIALAPNEMLAIEALPAAAARRPVVEGCRYSVVSESSQEYVFDLIAETSQPISVRIHSPARIAEILVDNIRQSGRYGNEAALALAMPVAPRPLEVEDLSGAGAPLRNAAKVTLPDGTRGGQFCLVCEHAASAVPLGPITVNGKSVKPGVLTGDRWKTFIVPLKDQASTVAWGVQVSARPKTPFAARSLVMSSYAAANRPLRAKRVTIRLAEALGPASPSLPTPFAAQKADLLPIQAAREVATIPPGGPIALSAAQFKTLKAARLHLAIFGANPEDRYAHKPVALNGQVIGILPANSRYNVDQWTERVMEIPASKLAAIAAQNAITVANCGGDCFKIGDAALAVQLPDGTWVESDRISTVYCGCGVGWPHHEGIAFSQQSPPIRLTLPVASGAEGRTGQKQAPPATKKLAPAKKKAPPVKCYTDPQQTDADFKFQGEYVGELTQADGAKVKLGAQVRALGDGNFRTMFFVGGLPGDGWDGTSIIQKAPSTDSMVPTDAKRAADKVVIDQVYKGTVDGHVLAGQTDRGAKFELQRVHRQSPTLGAKPPAGAMVLFDGTNTDHWQPGARLTPDKLLGPGATTKQKFQDFTLHVEFMISYAPAMQSIGQRPNSGVYLQKHYEIQVLDSFGVVERTHDCGVLYGLVTPTVNMCYPPLTWQAYDIDFMAARYDATGKKTRLAKCSVKFNGVLILDNVDIRHTTGGGTPESPEPGSIYLQYHGLPVFYRNLWLVEKK